MTSRISDSGRFAELLRSRARWVGDGYLHLRVWWRDPEVLRGLGPALAALHEESPTVIAGTQSSGYMLGPLVAVHLGVGFLALRKAPAVAVSALVAAPIGSGEQVLACDRDALSPTDRVLLVDDLVETGQQARAARELVLRAGAHWLGVAAVVAFETHEPALGVRSLIEWEALR